MRQPQTDITHKLRVNEPDNVITVTGFPYQFDCLETVWIPLSDGIQLAARIWLPQSEKRQRLAIGPLFGQPPGMGA